MKKPQDERAGRASPWHPAGEDLLRRKDSPTALFPGEMVTPLLHSPLSVEARARPGRYACEKLANC
jgi:hypothetical protein